jgi:hypothetical protein
MGHNNLAAAIDLRYELLPGVRLSLIDEILGLGSEILKVVYNHYAQVDPPLEPVHSGGAKELIDWIKQVQRLQLKKING